jgi:hypothetical protein
MHMSTPELFILFKESLFMIVVFAVFLIYAMSKGKYGLINIIFSLYLALLISLKFPYYDQLNFGGGESGAIAKIIIFLAFFVVGIFLHRRHIPGDDFETFFQSLWKKVLLALMATILVMIFSFHALPVTEIITPGTPIQALFAPKENFFWWLLLPLIALFFV